MRALVDADEDIRMAAAQALGKIGNSAAAAAVIPGLIEALKDSDRLARYNAAEALGRIGPRTDGVIPALVRVMRDMDPTVRDAASGALERIGMPAFPTLRALLCDDNSATRFYAVQALSGLATIQGQNSPEDETAEKARDRAKAARAALVAAFEDPDERIRTGAALALGNALNDAVSDLIAALGDTSPLVRLNAARALGTIGPEATAALAPLRERLLDSDPDVRRVALATIKAILEPDP